MKSDPIARRGVRVTTVQKKCLFGPAKLVWHKPLLEGDNQEKVMRLYHTENLHDSGGSIFQREVTIFET